MATRGFAVIITSNFAFGYAVFRGPRHCLRIDILLDVRYFAISEGNVEDPLVPVRLIRRIDFSRSDADDQNPVSLRHEFGGSGYVVSSSSDAF